MTSAFLSISHSILRLYYRIRYLFDFYPAKAVSMDKAKILLNGKRLGFMKEIKLQKMLESFDLNTTIFGLWK